MKEDINKESHPKLKLMYLARILQVETDDRNTLTAGEIIDKLAELGIHEDRKTLYRDLEELRAFGLDIIKEKRERNYYYHLGAREFELPELKLLVDAVQSSRFITLNKSKALIRKLESLTSRHEASKLQRQVFISGRIKTMNESIYYNVDKVHEAINADRQIQYKYVQWNLEKEAVPRHGGAWYQISPWALMWDNQNYYMVGYDAAEKKIKHFRVDKMQNISVSTKAREGREAFRRFDIPRYANTLFKMFGGEEKNVTLEVDNSMVGIIIDRFGKDVEITPVDEEHFRTDVHVAVSPQFLGWVMSMGGGVRIAGPEDVVRLMRDEVEKLQNQYKRIE